MSQSPDPEGGSPLSVAELLARHGGPAPSGGRRRRRAPDSEESEETAPQPVVERLGSPADPSGSSQRPGRRRAPDPTDPPDSAGAAEPPMPRTATEAPFSRSIPYRSSLTSYAPAEDVEPATVGRDDGPSTAQIPRTGRQPTLAPSPTPEPSPVPSPPQARQRQPAVPPAPAQQDAPDGVEEGNAADREPATLREWAVVTGQVGAGVVGGAVLWLACEWLWQRIPVLALVVALAVITGLVWVVRRVRRAEDLQTTIVAVLVGLFVTVSPAALLLVGR